MKLIVALDVSDELSTSLFDFFRANDIAVQHTTSVGDVNVYSQVTTAAAPAAQEQPAPEEAPAQEAPADVPAEVTPEPPVEIEVPIADTAAEVRAQALTTPYREPYEAVTLANLDSSVTFPTFYEATRKHSTLRCKKAMPVSEAVVEFTLGANQFRVPAFIIGSAIVENAGEIATISIRTLLSFGAGTLHPCALVVEECAEGEAEHVILGADMKHLIPSSEETSDASVP